MVEFCKISEYSLMEKKKKKAKQSTGFVKREALKGLSDCYILMYHSKKMENYWKMFWRLARNKMYILSPLSDEAE